MKPINLTGENFDSTLESSKLPVLVDFWAPWCGYCIKLSPEIDSLAEKYDGKLSVGKVNLDENSSIGDRFGIVTIPTLILFKNGQAGEPLIAPETSEDIENWLKL